MTSTFKSYLNQPKALTFEEMQNLHQAILSGISNDEDAKEIYESLMKKAIKYAHIRAEWPTLSREEKLDTDSNRTSCHNSVITNFNMLARYLKSVGKDVTWRDELGYEEDDPSNRKRIGDFACYLAFVDGINAR